MRRLLTPLILLLATGLLAPASSLAGASEDYLALYKAYKATGGIDGCAFSAKKLASAKKGVTPDVETYASDFIAALDTALRQRASGACDGKSGAAAGTSTKKPTSTTPAAAAPSAPATPATPATAATGGSGAAGVAPAATTTPAPAPDAAPAPAVADGSVATAAARNARATTADDAPFPLVLLAILAGLALLAGLAWALVRFFALDPPWLAAGRHATAEAGWRASASWAEFTDWIRLGR